MMNMVCQPASPKIEVAISIVESGPPIALAASKRELNHASGSSLAEALEMEGLAQSVNAKTDDMREAMIAFMERRPPTFTGK